MTASLLKSPGLFSVFWLFSIMLLLGWSALGRQLPNLPGPLIIRANIIIIIISCEFFTQALADGLSLESE